MTKKYDDAKWHYGGEFPADLPWEAGATHIGMFFAWAVLSGLGSDSEGMFKLDELLGTLANRGSTPGAIFIRACDGKFLDGDLTAEGANFATAYYENSKGYVPDYAKTLGKKLPTLYHVEDSWDTFDRLKPVLDTRLDEWKRGVLKFEEEK